MKRMNAGVVVVLAGVGLLPGAAPAQVIISQRCNIDNLEPSRAEARVEWMRWCALTKGTGGVFDTGIPAATGGTLQDYTETSTDPWWGKNMYTGPSDMGEVNMSYINKLYMSGYTYQGIDANGFYKWWRDPARKRARALYPTYGSESDINSASNRQLFPHPTLAHCGFYFDRNGTQPVPAGQSFYVNGYCENSSPPPTALTSGVPVGVSSVTSSFRYFSLSVPAGAASVVFETSGGTGDVDLYVRRGALPESTIYDCRPLRSGNNEVCTMPLPAAGTWYVMLKEYRAYSGVTLKGTIYH